MLHVDFFNQNLNRAYPLKPVEQADALYGALVFCRFIMRPEIDYDPGKHAVLLKGVAKLDSVFTSSDGAMSLPIGLTYVFEISTPALADYCFVANVPSPKKFARAFAYLVAKKHAYEALGLTHTGSTAIRQYVCEGLIVMGNPDSVPATIVLPESIPIEPTLVLPVPEYAGGPGRGTVYVYDKRRTTYVPPAPCAHAITFPPPHPSEFILQCAVTTPVRLSGGHSSTVSQSILQGTITIDASPGKGDLGFACDDLPLFEGEESPTDRLDGALTCKDVFRSINGMQGPDVTIAAGTGVQIGSYPQINRIVIGIDASGTSNCASFNPAEIVQCIPADTEGRSCGEGGASVPCPPTPDTSVGYADKEFLDTVKDYSGSKTIWTKYKVDGESYAFVVPTCGTPCSWAENAGSWELISFGCVSPCNCPPPPRTPAPGEVATTVCSEMGPDAYHVRNADFISSPALAGWDATGDVEILTTHTTISTQDLPVAKLYTENNGTLASLTQKYLPLKRGDTYTVQFDAFVEEGSLVVEIFENGHVLFKHVVEKNADMVTVTIPNYVPRTLHPTVVVTAVQTTQSIAVVYFARLGFIDA
jgi:hypothetical protein